MLSKKNLRVIALLRENINEISLQHSESDPALKKKLENFGNKVKEGRLVRFCRSAEELPGLVALSLSHAIRMYPAIGWVRANRISNKETFSEIK